MRKRIVTFSIYFTAAIWVVNGLLCKVLGLVMRHELIVARILGAQHALLITKAIGMGEILMAVWILIRIQPRWSFWAQVVIVAVMNILEFILAPDLLLFGRLNIVIAALFILFLSYIERLRTNREEAVAT